MAKAESLSPPISSVPKSSLWQRMRKGRWGYAFVSPFYILFAVFGLYPMLLSIFLSFTIISSLIFYLAKRKKRFNCSQITHKIFFQCVDGHFYQK